MAKSCIFKIILGGSAGKTAFINRAFKHHNNDDYFHIGVNFKLLDCLVNNEDNYLLQIWDFKVLKDFQFLYPSFCKGAKGALLFFDVTDYKSFKELSFWIKTIRNMAGNIPIILIGTKVDEGNREVLENDINDLMRNNNINSVFYTSAQENDQNIIFKHLIESVDHYSYIQEFSILASEFDENFEEFMRVFSDCPLCGRALHSSYLKRFFYSRNRKTISLKNRLLELIEESKDYEELYYNEIKLGITCCKCFKAVFE
jgi:GTPase SAR1 family protein